MLTLSLPAAPQADSTRDTTFDVGGRAVEPRFLAARLAAREDLWRPHVRFTDPRSYTRLLSRPGWEAWLLTWLPGQSTELHDHGGAAGAFAVLSGVLEETVLAPGASTVATRVRCYRSGEVRAFGPRHVHDVAAGGVPAVSLHVYAPGLTRMTRYTLEDGGLVELVSEQAGADW